MAESRVRLRQSVKQFKRNETAEVKARSWKAESASLQKHLLAAHKATFAFDRRMSRNGEFSARRVATSRSHTSGS